LVCKNLTGLRPNVFGLRSGTNWVVGLIVCSIVFFVEVGRSIWITLFLWGTVKTELLKVWAGRSSAIILGAFGPAGGLGLAILNGEGTTPKIGFQEWSLWTPSYLLYWNYNFKFTITGWDNFLSS
jgi:hypothetical protein